MVIICFLLTCLVFWKGFGSAIITIATNTIMIVAIIPMWVLVELLEGLFYRGL